MSRYNVIKHLILFIIILLISLKILNTGLFFEELIPIKYHDEITLKNIIESTYVQKIKEIITIELNIYVANDNFKLDFNKTYYDIVILKQQIVKSFIENYDWKIFIREIEQGKYQNDFDIENKILEQFNIYLKNKTTEYNKAYLYKTFITILSKNEALFQELSNYMEHFDNAEITIRTKGFLRDVSRHYTEQVITRGFGISVCFDDHSSIRIVWYDNILYEKKI